MIPINLSQKFEAFRFDSSGSLTIPKQSTPQDLVQIVANSVQEKQRDQDSEGWAGMAVRTAREHQRWLCQGPAQHWARAKAEAGLRRGRGSSGSSQPSAQNRNWNCAGLAATLSWESTGTAVGPKQHCSLCCSEPAWAPTPGLQLLLALLSSKDTVKCGLHQQGGKSISAMPTLQCAFPLPCTFTSNYSAFQPWKTNFTQFHSKFYLTLYEWLLWVLVLGFWWFFDFFFFNQETNI